MMKNIFSIIYRQVIDDIRLYIFHALFRISINYPIVFFIATIIDRYILYYISIYFVKWRITRYFQLFQVIDNIYLLLPIIRISMIAIHFITFVIKKKKGYYFYSLSTVREKFSSVKDSSQENVEILFSKTSRKSPRGCMKRDSLIHFAGGSLSRANFAPLKSSWNNPNSYHMAVLETFPPTNQGRNKREWRANKLPPPSPLLLAKLWRRIPTTSQYQIRGNSKSNGKEENSRANNHLFVRLSFVSSRMKALTRRRNAVQGRNRGF